MKKIIGFVSMLALAIAPMSAKKQAAPEKDTRGAGISIGTLLDSAKDIDKGFSDLKDAGFTSCQIDYRKKACTPEVAKKVKEASEKYGIRMTTYVGVPGHSEWNFIKGPSTIGLVPFDGREQKIADYHDMIDFCQMAGIPAMHSHFGFIPEDPSSAEYQYFIVVMRDLANYAKERGVEIYFETGQETPITLIRAIKDIGTGNVFINCDLANLMLYGKANPTDAIRLFGDLVKDVHAKDGTYPDRDEPNKLGHEKPIPEGDVDFPAVIELLKERGYNGSLTIEYELSDGNRDYLVKTREYLQNLIDTKN